MDTLDWILTVFNLLLIAMILVNIPEIIWMFKDSDAAEEQSKEFMKQGEKTNLDLTDM